MEQQTDSVSVQRFRPGSLLPGILLLCALIGAVLHFGEIERFIELIRQAAPLWIGVGLLLQGCTYLGEAWAWQISLSTLGFRIGFGRLIPLSVAKLFSDQAMPTGGMSGAAFFLAALRRQGVDGPRAMACQLVDLVTHFLAYLLMAIFNLLVLAWYHALNRWEISVTIVLSLVALAIPLLLVVLRRSAAAAEALTSRFPRFDAAIGLLRDAPSMLLNRPSLVARQLGLHATEMLLDAASLWAMLKAVGQGDSFLVAFSGYMTAAIVATLSPIPLGLGTFEATCVAMLQALGVELEAGLLATIMLRGLMVWTPMLPGGWLVRRTLRQSP